MVNRFIFVAIPLLIIAIPFIRIIPELYRWRMRRKIYRWYGELRVTENAVRSRQGDPATHSARLDRIEEQLDRLRVPPAYSAELYALLVHIQLVRNLLSGSLSNPSPGESSPGGSQRPAAAS